MPENESSPPELVTLVRRLTWLASINLAVMIALLIVFAVFLIPKLERAVATTERVEQRFQSFADDVQPVLGAGAGKAVETIEGMDADRLSESATESSDETIRAIGERAKRFFDRDRPDEDQPEQEQ